MVQEQFIPVQIRRTNRNLGILSLLAILAGLVLLTLGGAEAFWRVILAMVKAPFSFDVLGEIVLSALELLYFIIGLSALIYGLKRGLQLLSRILSRERHPIYKEVAYYGVFDEVAQNIHYDLTDEKFKKYRNLYLTEHWIMQMTAFHLSVLKLEDVVWAYEKVTKEEQGIVVPGSLAVGPSEVAKTYSVVIHSRNPWVPLLQTSLTHELDLTEDREGNACVGEQKRAYIGTILEELKQRHPKAIYGYSKDLHDLWSHDRTGFINHVF